MPQCLLTQELLLLLGFVAYYIIIIIIITTNVYFKQVHGPRSINTLDFHTKYSRLFN